MVASGILGSSNSQTCCESPRSRGRALLCVPKGVPAGMADPAQWTPGCHIRRGQYMGRWTQQIFHECLLPVALRSVGPDLPVFHPTVGTNNRESRGLRARKKGIASIRSLIVCGFHTCTCIYLLKSTCYLKINSCGVFTVIHGRGPDNQKCESVDTHTLPGEVNKATLGLLFQLSHGNQASFSWSLYCATFSTFCAF